jgi:hypothetical protein
MRRIAPRQVSRCPGIALLLALTCAATMAAGAVSARAASGLTLKPDQEGQTEIVQRPFGIAGRTWGFWGTLLRANNSNKWGSYRATCVWLANMGASKDKRDNRFVCTVVLTADNGGTLIAQGQLIRPRKNGLLFTRTWECTSARRHAPPGCGPRSLAITGATTPYRSKLGYAVDLATAGRIAITEHL